MSKCTNFIFTAKIVKPRSSWLIEIFILRRETEDGWDDDIKEESKEECSNFGTVNHIFVDKNSEGFVYIKFSDSNASQNAQKALHNRFFAGRKVIAEYQFVKAYDQHFNL